MGVACSSHRPESLLCEAGSGVSPKGSSSRALVRWSLVGVYARQSVRIPTYMQESFVLIDAWWKGGSLSVTSNRIGDGASPGCVSGEKLLKGCFYSSSFRIKTSQSGLITMWY